MCSGYCQDTSESQRRLTALRVERNFQNLPKHLFQGKRHLFITRPSWNSVHCNANPNLLYVPCARFKKDASPMTKIWSVYCLLKKINSGNVTGFSVISFVRTMTGKRLLRKEQQAISGRSFMIFH